MVHFRYGLSVPFPQLPTPPRGDAVEFMFRREQSNSTGGTLTHVSVSFTGVASRRICLELHEEQWGLQEAIEKERVIA